MLLICERLYMMLSAESLPIADGIVPETQFERRNLAN